MGTWVEPRAHAAAVWQNTLDSDDELIFDEVRSFTANLPYENLHETR